MGVHDIGPAALVALRCLSISAVIAGVALLVGVVVHLAGAGAAVTAIVVLLACLTGSALDIRAHRGLDAG